MKNFLKILGIVFLPEFLAKRIPVAFIYDLPDWEVRIVALDFFKNIPRRARLRMRGTIKNRAKSGNFDMQLLACQLNLYIEDKAQQVQILVDTAKIPSQITDVLTYIDTLDRQQKLTLLTRLGDSLEGAFAWESIYEDFFMEASKDFPELSDRRQVILQKETPLMGL
ncbi:MAG: hypothetical protein KBC22_03260 [Candidatus Pacebacteria bacterium]|nr:hypothetical protein [Candidatus Paceibacterota bacterium]